MEWTRHRNGKLTVAKGEMGPTIYRANPDGTLLIFGADWKECLMERCKRVKCGEWGDDKKCRRCVRNGTARLDSQRQAVEVAELIQGQCARHI